MIVMHGLFDLIDDVPEQQFRECFDRFSEHLHAFQLVLSFRFMRHQPHDGYNADAPSTQHYVAVEFASMDHAQRCWDYIEVDDEPVRSLHVAVFSKIRNSKFFLTSDI